MFLVPSQSHVITRFVATVSHVGAGAEGRYEDEIDLVVSDVVIAGDGTFGYSGEWEENEFWWRAVNGTLLPNGDASGACIGVMNSNHGYGSSGWRKWTAARNDEVEVSSESFLWRWGGG